MDGVLGKFKRYLIKYRIALVAGIISAVLTFSVVAAFLCRNYAIGLIKNQFYVLGTALNSVGLDYAYDDISFYSFSPWQIIRIKNIKFYSVKDNTISWTIDELNVDVGLWDYENIHIFLSSKQTIQKGKDIWDVFVPVSEISLALKANGLEDVVLKSEDIQVKNLIKIDDLVFKIKNDEKKGISVDLNVKGVVIDDMTGWTLNKEIDHVVVEASLQEVWNEDMAFNDMVYNWLKKGGNIKVNRVILNWKPLISVASGVMQFSEKFEPKVSLNTASIALIETLEKLNDQGFISNKGTFVVKILLENKAKKQRATDKHKMVVSPLKISKDKILLENIRIR